MLGAAPFIVPSRWHTRIIDWREQLFRKRLMTRQDLAEFDIEIRDLYFAIAAELLDTRVPALGNKTPRQAARTLSGRERLEALLAQFDRDATADAATMAPLAVIRSQLGLTK